MKGPILFLVAAIAAATAGHILVRPVLDERNRLVEELAGAKPAAVETPPEVRAAIDRTVRAAGPTGAEATRRIREVAHVYSARPQEGDGEIHFVTEWRRVASLLDELSESAGAIRSFTAEAVEDPERCRVTIRIVP